MTKSWFQQILGSAQAALRTRGEDFVVERLGFRQGVEQEFHSLIKGHEYVTIRVKSSRIVDVRRWTSTFYGCIQSRAHYLHGDRGLLEYQAVIVPDMMKDLDPKNLDRMLTIDKPVLGPVPFIGGLSLELGLFSVKGSDLAGPYINLLSNLAQASGVGFAAMAQPFIEPLRQGADLLFGNAAQSELEIGIDRSWNDLTTGVWLIMRAAKGSVTLADLRCDPSDFKLTDASGKPYRNHPYIVLSIEGNRTRDDWMMIPEIKDSWDAVGVAAKAGNLNEAEQLLRQFILVCNWSADLVPDDAKRLAAKAKAKLPDLQQETTIALRETAVHPLGGLEELALYRD